MLSRKRALNFRHLNHNVIDGYCPVRLTNNHEAEALTPQAGEEMGTSHKQSAEK